MLEKMLNPTMTRKEWEFDRWIDDDDSEDEFMGFVNEVGWSEE